MDEDLRARLLADVAQLANDSMDVDLDPLLHGMSWGSGDRRLTLTIDDAIRFADLVRAWLGRYGDRLSETFVSDRLVELLFAARDSPGDVDRLVDEFARAYDTCARRTVHVQIDGLHLVIDRLAIGDVTFARMEGRALESVLARVRKLGTDAATGVERADWITFQSDTITQRLAGTVCAIVATVAEPLRAQELAEEKARGALDVLMYANVSAAPFHPLADAVLALVGDKPSDRGWTLLLSDAGVEDNLLSPPPAWPMEVSWGTLIDMHDAGVGEVARMLAAPENQTDLECQILKAIHWFGSAQLQRDVGGKITDLFTAIEVLVPRGVHTQTGKRLPLGAARILGQEKDGWIHENVTRIYHYRNQVAHEGATDKTAFDAQALRWIVALMIRTLIVNLPQVPDIATLDARLTAEQPTGRRLLSYPTHVMAPVRGAGRSLRQLRIARGLSEDELIAKMGGRLMREQLAAWERSAEAPGLPELLELSSALGVDPLDLEWGRHERLLSREGRYVSIKTHRLERRWGRRLWKATVAGFQVRHARGADREPPIQHRPTLYLGSQYRIGRSPEEALDRLEKRVAMVIERGG